VKQRPTAEPRWRGTAWFCTGLAQILAQAAKEQSMNLNLEGIIPIAGGLLASLIGYGVVQIKPGALEQKWRSRLKWLGPVVVAFGLLLLFRVL
jgi:hypothetical protein